MAAGRPQLQEEKTGGWRTGWRQGSLEIWRVGGREAQPQAGRSGLGWRLGKKEGSAAGRKISSWVGSQEARAAGREDKDQRCRQGGAEARGAGRGVQAGLPALSMVLKHGTTGSPVLATVSPHRTPVGTSCPGKGHAGPRGMLDIS